MNPQLHPRQRKLTFKQRAEIIRKHFDKKVPQSQLAIEYKVSREMIGRYCRRNGVSPLLKEYELDDKKIVNFYLNEERSVKQIADILGITPRPVKRRLRLNGIKKRTPSLRKKWEKELPHYAMRMKIWVAKVIERDGMKCKLCGCENTYKNGLEANHIIPVRDMLTPELLFDVNNGITLCRECHMSIHFHEKEYEKTFFNLIK